MIFPAIQKMDVPRSSIHQTAKLFVVVLILIGAIYYIFQKREPKRLNDQYYVNYSDNSHAIRDNRSDSNAAKSSSSAVSVRITKTKLKRIIPSTALKASSVELFLIDSLNLPPLEIGMVNVTDNKRGYHIKSGNDSLKIITIRFSESEIPNGYTTSDVHTYYFNPVQKHWIELRRDSIDVRNNIVYSVNTEDGDYINAIIKSPESPETAGFIPTTLKDLKVGDPSSMIQLIEAPTQSSTGSASIRFHIETPKGRQEIEPNLDVLYSSDGGNGIMGEGWSFGGISTISVETRWGVPQYTSGKESETYSWDGKMLAVADDNDNLTMAHRKLNITRNSGRETKRFFCRRETNFSKIERIGSMDDYIWVITDKNGTKYYYGGLPTVNQPNDVDAVLRDGKKIAEWKLRKVEDLFKNSMEFYYELKTKDVSGNPVRSIYPTQILYTLYLDEKHQKDLYKVDFGYDDTERKDFSFSARYGFLSSDNSRLLKSIKVSSSNFLIDGSETDNVNIRKYAFNYSYGSYSKILLDSISQFGYAGDTEARFYSQKFNYYSFDSLRGNYFTAAQINLPEENFLGKSDTKAKLGFGGAVGIGFPDFQFTSKSLSLDAQFSYKENESESTVSFIDIDGDARPDIVTKKGNRITYRPNTSSFNQISFGPERSITGINSFGKDDGSSQGFGAEVNGPTQSRVYGGVDNNTTHSYSRYYFTDANGDGLIDVVENGEVKFNTYDGTAGSISFNNSSGSTPSPISRGNAIGATLVTEDRDRINTELANNIMISPLHDVVKMWIAPDSGTVRIDAPANLLRPALGNSEEDSLEYKKSDGVWISVQQNSAYIFNPLGIDKGDFAVKPISIASIRVSKGDKILFRVQSGNSSMANGDYDQVKWNPVITYLSKNEDKHFIDPFNKKQFEFNALQDHLYDNEVFNLPDSGKYSIFGEFKKPRTKDAVTLKIRLSGRIIKDSSRNTFAIKRPQSQGGDTTINITEYSFVYKDSVFTKTLDRSAQIFATNFPVPTVYSYNTSLSFELIPASNFDLARMEWKPRVVYQYYDTTEQDAAIRWKKDSILYFPRTSFKGQVLKSGIFIKVKDSGLVKISPIITLNKGKKVKATLIISDKDSILLKKEINQSQYLTDTISFVRDKNEFFTVYYEIDSSNQIDLTPTTGNVPSYLLMPHDFKDWVVPQTGRYSFYSTKNRVLARSIIRINGRDSLPHNRDTLDNVFLMENDVISFIDTVSKGPVQFSTILTQASAVFTSWEMNDYGQLYRGWGQGVINGSNYFTRPIDINAFRLSDVKRAQYYETEFFSMPYDPKALRNIGANKRIYINRDTLSSSRMAMSDVNPAPLFVVSSTINAAGAIAPVKYSKSTSTSIAFGGGGFTVNESNNGNTLSYSDYVDLNGDRYPDVAGISSVQYTTSLGGLQNGASLVNTGLQHTTANSRGINLGGIFFHPFITAGKSTTQKSNSTSTASSKIAAALAGLSGGYNENKDAVQANLYDINGDGLPDKVTQDGGIFINMGNGFSSQVINWGLESIQTNASKTIGAGGGYNFDNYSGSAGINFATTTTEQNSSLIDFNGDGLIDNVVKTSNDDVIFYLNTGNGISKVGGQRIVLGSSVDIGKSVSKSRGINGAFTFAPHIFALFVPICKIPFSVSSNIGDGNNSIQSQWIDINGDGFIDYVSYDGNTVRLKLSNLGKINRLKSVSGPLGGNYVLDFKHVQGDFRHPGGKWVMASVIKNDGIPDNGNNYRTDFEYEQGYYDRFEREFLGFKKVTAINYLDNRPYRKIVQEYTNQNYFMANQLSKKWIEDSTGKKYQYEEYAYYEKYRNRASRTNQSVPTPPSLITVAVMQNLLKSKTAYTYEGTNSKILLNQITYKYDSLLNVINYNYMEGNSLNQQNSSFYRAEITYKNIEPTKYIYGLPTLVIVRDKSNKVLKKVKANYPSGLLHYKMQSDTVFFSDKSFATTIYRYDDKCGNLITKTYPNGLRDTLEFDDRFGIYVTRIVDPYKLENRFQYDFRFGSETEKELTSGLKIKTKYDNFGRVIKVQGPQQNSTDIDDADYTIKVEYNTAPGRAYSIVKHFDEQNKDAGIYTINFVDGFGKNIQVKKTGVVNGSNKWIVSGRQFHDGLFRLRKYYYPTTQNYDVSGDMLIGNTGKTLKLDTNNIAAAITSYDVLDRVASTRLSNGKLFENNVYTIKKDDFNNEAQVTITTYGNDAKLNKKEVFTNGAGLVSCEKFYLAAGNDSLAKTTKYQYDPIHQLDSVYNIYAGKQYLVIANSYDWDGRKNQYFNLSSGTTTFEYDKISNLKRKVNAKSDIIDYDYEHRRLIRITYPKHPEDSVRYVYGVKSGPGTSNSVGRIVFQIDATGAQSFMHDVYGNVTFNTRTIVAPFDTTYTFTSRFVYDSWGRITEMTYPSGELVSYKYDVAGNVVKVYGSRHGTNAVNFPYVNNITYDEFEQRKSIVYGNTLVTNYNYEDTLRRLSFVRTMKGTSEIMLSSYKYDELNNIKQAVNKSSFPGMSAVNMKHDYDYDNQNQLSLATGEWNGSTKYSLDLSYDDQFNIKTRKLDLISPQITRNINSSFAYKNNNPLQLDFINDRVTRKNPLTRKSYRENNTSHHYYDEAGNDVMTSVADSFQSNVNERKILWDEENRIRSISVNGYVSSYTYDASGARTIKTSNEIDGVYINGQFAGESTSPATYSLYVSPYFSVRNAKGIGTKHIYIGEERIVSQLTNYIKWPTIDNEVSTRHPERDTLEMTETLAPRNKFIPVRYIKKMLKTEALINSYFDSLQVPHKTIPHNAFKQKWPVLTYPPTLTYPFPTEPAKQFQTGTVDNNVDGDEKLRYFYHRSQIGSTSFISDKDQNIVQYVEYLPFGETFMESRKDYSSQFLFNGKEQDQETGLYYYGARYYDAQTYQWLGVDPVAEKYAGQSPYMFSFNNPVRMHDPNGMEATDEFSCYYVNETENSGKNEWLYKLNQYDKPIEPSYLIENTLGAVGLAKGAVGLVRWGIAKYATTQTAETLPFLATEFSASNGGSKYLYHYTSEAAAQNISKTGLRTSKDGFAYLTNTSNLSPLQAQIELALPVNRTLPTSIIRVDASGLSPSIIRRVQGNLPGMGAGGGTEFLFNQNIPANLINIIK